MSTRLAALLLLAACRSAPPPEPPASASSSSSPSTTSAPLEVTPPLAPSSIAARATPPRTLGPLAMLGGGDVSFGRLQGQMLLDDPKTPFFAKVAHWFQAADVRFCNLEGPLADRGRETVRPGAPLVFVGPPAGAPALAALGIDVASTANNHAWDYGLAALEETLVHLDQAGVAHAGTGKDPAAAFAPAILERRGYKIAFFAVTDIFNDGVLKGHAAAEHLADAALERVPDLVRALRTAPGAPDLVVLSYHGGEEYNLAPLEWTRTRLRAAVDAGVDVVFGHHPHVLQGIELRGRGVIFYSLGNLLMRMHSKHPETQFGLLGRVSFEGGVRARVEVCPFHIHHVYPMPLERAHQGPFRALFGKARGYVDGAALGEPTADGCIRVKG